MGSVTLVSTVAVAGTGVGGLFDLGQSNSVNATTTLTGATSGKQLQVTNSSTGAGAAGIGIKVSAGKPPLVVNSSTKVAGLNADQLDGLDATAFQRPLNSTCPNNTAVSAVTSSGAVTCSRSVVLPIATDLAIDVRRVIPLSPSSLALTITCNSGVRGVQLVNNSSGAATLNWMFSQGGTSSTVNAGGAVIAAFDHADFFLGGGSGRREGQWIFAEPAGVATVNLHFFDGGSFCETRGTAEVALLP